MSRDSLTPRGESAVPLLPCPFCGGDARADGSERVGFFVSCNGCFCCVGEAYDHAAYPEHMFRDRDEAVAAWNRRAPGKES